MQYGYLVISKEAPTRDNGQNSAIEKKEESWAGEQLVLLLCTAPHASRTPRPLCARARHHDLNWRLAPLRIALLCSLERV